MTVPASASQVPSAWLAPGGKVVLDLRGKVDENLSVVTKGEYDTSRGQFSEQMSQIASTALFEHLVEVLAFATPYG